MYKRILFFFLMSTVMCNAQFNLVSISPVDGAVNVQQNVTISVEFNQPIDTLKGFKFFQDFFTNVFDLQAKWFSEDLKTVNLGGNLEPDKNYYFLVYSAFSQNGEALSNPSVVYFTTGSVLSGRTISGNVSSNGNGAVDLSKTLVALSSTPIDEGEPLIEAGTFANSAGDYSIPHVNDGDYYPIAANDLNGDGELDPSGGDAFSFLDIISINGNYNGLDFTLSVPDLLDLTHAYSNSDSLKQLLLPVNAELKRINSWDSDSLGNAGEWEFYYITDTVNRINRLRIDQFGYDLESRYDEWEYQKLVQMDEITSIDNAADLNVFIANAEAAGGYDFRKQTKPKNLQFSFEIILADHRYSYLSDISPDTSRHLMWAAVYRWNEQISLDEWQTESQEVYFGDYLTGALIITDIENTIEAVPNSYSLKQNYPNPFNPTTTIQYSIPVAALSSVEVQNVTLKVYDILGKEITTLIDENKSPGNYEVRFDSSEYPSGIYIYTIHAGNFNQSRKMILIK